tara:strand:+ start:158 stop:472 length:315 start_codon:yes stop_codon:yes gene_type:complete
MASFLKDEKYAKVDTKNVDGKVRRPTLSVSAPVLPNSRPAHLLPPAKTLFLPWQTAEDLVKAFVLDDDTKRNDEAKYTRMASMKKWFSDQLPVQRIKVSAVIPD